MYRMYVMNVIDAKFAGVWKGSILFMKSRLINEINITTPIRHWKVRHGGKSHMHY